MLAITTIPLTFPRRRSSRMCRPQQPALDEGPPEFRYTGEAARCSM